MTQAFIGKFAKGFAQYFTKYKIIIVVSGFSWLAGAHGALAESPSVVEIVEENKVIEESEENDDIFYLTKICTDENVLTTGMCQKGYILKTETQPNGQVVSSIFMDDLEGYGWTHSSIEKVNEDVYKFTLTCGTSCGGHALVGRNNKNQWFEYYFDYDPKFRCSIEYEPESGKWIARALFSEVGVYLKTPVVPTDSPNSMVYPPWHELEFNDVGNIFVGYAHNDEVLDIIENPCQR